MSNYSKQYTQTIDPKPYSKLSYNNTNTSTKNYFLKQNTNNIQPNTKKQTTTPYQFNYNLENQKPAAKEQILKAKFQQIKKKYDFTNKFDSNYKVKVSPLKQAPTKNNLQINSIKKYSQPKNIMFETPKQISLFDEKIQRLQRKTADYNFLNAKQLRLDTKPKLPEQKNKSSFIENKEITSKSKIINLKQIEVSNEEQINISHVQKTTETVIRLEEKRIQSIDRINQKIQKIIKSINQNQKYNAEKSQKKQNYPDKPNHRNLSIDYTDLQKNKPVQQNPKSQLNRQTQYLTKKQKSYSQLKTQTKSIQNAQNRSYSAIPKKPIQNNDNSLNLKNGKDVNQQIRKIHERIRKTEDQKRKLNIKFQGFQQYNVNKADKQLKQQKKFSFDLRTPENIKVQEYVVSSKIIKKEQIKKQDGKKVQQIKKQSIRKQEIKKQQNKKQQIRIQQKYRNSNNRLMSGFNKSSNQQRSISKIQTQRLTQVLKNQVKLDQNLRNLKLMFSLGQLNWKKLRSELQSKGISLSQSKINEQFTITLQQHDPFYSVRQIKESDLISQLVQKFIQSQKYFENNLKRKFNKQSLNKQRFREQNLDLQRKGYLTIQDFVRYLNIETGTFYRNRDLVLIFRRFTKQNKLSFQELLSLLSL